MTTPPGHPGPPLGDGYDPNDPYRYGPPQAPPPAYGQPPAPRGPRPQQVVTAVRLMYTRALLDVVGLIVLFATESSLKRQIRASTPTLDNSTLDAAITVGVVFGAVLLVFYVLLAFQVAKGRNWARIVTWVIGGLAVLGFLGGLAQPASGITRGLGVITLLIDVSVIVLLATRPSNDWFARPRY